MTIGDLLRVGLKNRDTTIIGNALAAGVYLDTVGFQLPSTQEEWIAFAISALISILSLLMKDARTGSAPK